jgi:hypothetical protein
LPGPKSREKHRTCAIININTLIFIGSAMHRLNGTRLV